MPLKNICLSIIFILISLQNQAQDIKVKSDLERMKLSGPVKSITTTQYEVENVFSDTIGKLRKKRSPWFSSYIGFDRNGNQISKKYYKVNGEIKNTWNTIYDKNNNRIADIRLNSNDSLTSKTTYDYNQNGKLIREIQYNSDCKVENSFKAKYNLKNKITEEKWFKSDTLLIYRRETFYENDKVSASISYNSNGEINSKALYEYDNRGNKIKTKYIGENNLTKSILKYKYNNDRKKVKEETYNSSGELTAIKTWKYDENGYKLEKTVFIPSSQNRKKTTYQNDVHGNMIERVKYIDDVISYKSIYDYDQNNNQIMVKGYDSEKELKSESFSKFEDDKLILKTNDIKSLDHISVLKFTLDHNKNWIKKEDYKDETIIHKTIRKIEYFKE